MNRAQQCILTILRHGDEYSGLKMIKESNGQLVRGAVYFDLGELERNGLVTSRPAHADPFEPNNPEHRRRAYRITHAGRVAIEEKLASL